MLANLQPLFLLAALVAAGASLSACGTQTKLLLLDVPLLPTGQSPLVETPTQAAPRFLGEVAVPRSFAGATAQAFRLGERTPIAEGTVGPDGRFSLALPASLPPGSLLFVAATQGAETASAIATVPPLRNLQALEPQVRLTLATTLSLASLAKRFFAAGQAGSPLQGEASASYQASMLGVYQALVTRAETILPVQPNAALGEAVLTALTPGTWASRMEAETLSLFPPALTGGVRSAAEALHALVLSAVASGGHVPDTDLLGVAGLGNNLAPPITFGGSGGGGASAPASPSPSPSPQGGTIVVRDGEVVDTSAPIDMHVSP